MTGDILRVAQLVRAHLMMNGGAVGDEPRHRWAVTVVPRAMATASG